MTAEPRTYNGRYEIERSIARGGMAEVHLAHDLLLDRPVALKVLYPELSVDQKFVERFRREAQAAANLSHQNIVSVYDWGEEDSTYFIVMEYVEGHSLAQILKSEGRLAADRSARIAAEVASALGFAHRHGVVHRDIKPGNVMIDDDGNVKVTDFGIAWGGDTSEDITKDGAVVGTALYLSPEQAQGHEVDARSDVYSLGVVLYEMLTGRTPFRGDSPLSIALKHVQEDPVPPREVEPNVPEGLDAITLAAMAKNKEERYPSADDMRADLRRFVKRQPPLALLRRNPVDPGSAKKPPVLGGDEQPGPVRSAKAGRPAARPDPGRGRGRGRGSKAAGAVAGVAAGSVAAGVAGVGSSTAAPAGAGGTAGGRATATAVPRSLVRREAGVTTRRSSTAAETDRDGRDGTPPPEDPDGAEGSGDDPNYLEAPEKRARLWPWVASAGVLLAGLGVLVFLLARLAGFVGTPAERAAATKIPVPAVAGLAERDAVEALRRVSLDPKVEDGDDPVQPKDTVMYSDPPPNTPVDINSAVKVVVNRSSGQVTMPRVVDQRREQAKQSLEALGFSVTEVTKYDTKVTEGFVLAQDPAAGTQAQKGAKVTLTVSTRTLPPVPDVAGQTGDQAKATLEALGYKVVIEQQRSTSVDAGLVIATDPPAGSKPTRSDTVTVKVARGSSSTTSSGSSSSTTSGSASR